MQGKSNAAFLDKPKQANVRVHAAEFSFPTVAALVQELESRRDTSEGLAMARVVQLELRLLKAENDIVKDVLRTSVARVLR